MSENYNVSKLGNGWFELATDAYQTYLKGVLLFQERYIEMTRAMLQQVNTVQEQGRGLVNEFASEAERSRTLFQNTVESTVKNSTESVREVSKLTREAIEEVRATTLQNGNVIPPAETLVVAHS